MLNVFCVLIQITLENERIYDKPIFSLSPELYEIHNFVLFFTNTNKYLRLKFLHILALQKK